MRQPSCKFWVNKAATRIRRRLLKENAGRLPRTAIAWVRLCNRVGVPVRPEQGCSCSYTARLVNDERLRGGWVIAFNPYVSARQICRFLCHELAEFLAIQDYPSLFDGLPTTVHAYTGGSDPDDARHRIAKQVERLSFRK